MANNIISGFTQFCIACYSLLHAFADPPNIIKNSFAHPEIQYYHSCLSIILTYSSVELYVKNYGSTIYKDLNENLDPYYLPIENRRDSVFLFHNWDKKKNDFVKHGLSRVLRDMPVQARKRFKTQNVVLDKDIQQYASYRKDFTKAKKLRDQLVHGSFDFSLQDTDFEKIYVWKKKENKLSLDVRLMPDKALDFFILSLKMLNYFTIVCSTGFQGNTREHIIPEFNIKELLFESVPFEFEIPQGLIDLLDQKLANYP